MCFFYCFPGSTLLTTKRGVKRMDELQPNDEILTLSRKSGIAKWTQFYTWGHREPNAVAEYLVLQLSDGNQLKISKEHLIFLQDDKGRKVAKTAEQLCIGDKLVHLGTNGELELLPVVQITSETITGIYAPFTMSGHFLADGILVGCYGDISDFDLAHAAMAPLRTWHRIVQSKGTKSQEGIHGYARKLMTLRNYLPTSMQSRVGMS